ncbi:MAG: MFS transporter [Thermomicrobiales bacterium]
MADQAAIRDERAAATVAPAGDSAAATSRKGTFHAIAHHREFRFLWTAGVVTQFGQWFQNIAIGWLALTLTDSPSFVGQVAFASGVPILLLSFPAGALLDRIDRRRALLAAQLLGALLALAIAFVNWRGWIEPWHLIVAAVLSGILLAVVQPATQSLAPALVPREDLANALALSSAGNSATRIIGPSLGGVLIGLLGIAGCYLAQAFTFVAAVALTAAVTVPRGARPGVTIGGGVLDGLRIIRRDPTLTGLLLLASAPALLAYPYIQLLPVFARDVLHLGPRGLGIIMSTSGIGAFTGALIVARLGSWPHKGRLTLIMGILYGFVLSAFALSPIPALSATILIFSGFIGSVFASTNQILVQLATSEEMRGRVMGALAISFGLMPVGALLIGTLAQQFGAPLAVTVGAMASTLCIALIAARYRTLWRL